MTGIVPLPALIVVTSRRYDVTLRRAMPATWRDRLSGAFWFWRVDSGGMPISSGYAWTERGAERKAERAARQHARPPARAKHTPPRMYSINL